MRRRSFCSCWNLHSLVLVTRASIAALAHPSKTSDGASPTKKLVKKKNVGNNVSRTMVHQPPRTDLDLPMAYTSFSNTIPIREFREKYNYLSPGERYEGLEVKVGGRLASLRDMGKIVFVTIQADGTELQVVGQVGDHFTQEDLKRLKGTLRVGDVIGVEGVPCRMLRGELSISASRILVLTPYVCSDQVICPDLRGFTVLQDNDVKYRYRFVDMMTNHSVIEVIKKRHVIVQTLRDFLNNQRFVEVETPILHSTASGANAKPFVTHHNANDRDLFLRVAPELHLKQCIVGGLERVYEIGKVFRNEDADRSHNPEFTSCEFYASFHTYLDLMPMTENIFRTLAVQANGSAMVQVQSVLNNEWVEIDLSKSFHRISVYDEIQRAAGVDLPPPSELNTPKGLAYMSAVMLRHGIPLPPIRTAAKMFDKLIDFFITDRIVEPTFVMDHPLFMSPLAKEHASKPGLSERFELFINGIEYCNAYSELNDPREQYRRFQQQLLDRQVGDEEAMSLDETFLKSLQVGLPPTAGWGMGIDRVVMLLTKSNNVRDGIIFPLLRLDIGSHDSKRRHRTAAYFGFNQQMTLFCLSGLEEEMKRCGISEASCELIREMRRKVVEIGQQNDSHYPETAANRLWNVWRLGLTMSIIWLMCGKP